MADTTTTRSASLLRQYTREKAFEPCEREKTRAWDGIKEAKDLRPGGSGRFYKIIENTGHPGSNSDTDGGDWPADRPITEVVLQVTAADIDSPVEITQRYELLAEDEGSFYGDADAEAVVRAMRELFSYADVLIGAGHGTGRLAVVGANSGPSTTVTLDDPEFAFQLRRGMPIEFVDLDTGGTVQATTSIESIAVDGTSIVVADAVTVTAGWGIYKLNAYGKRIPNGYRNIVDDGDLAATIDTGVRADHPALNAIVIDPGGLQDYSETLVNKLLNRIGNEQDFIPTELRCNVGITGEYLRSIAGDRFRMSNSDTETGRDSTKYGFLFQGKKLPFIEDRNLPARELYAIYKPALRKHMLRKADWVRGEGGAVFHQKPASGGDTYAYAKVGVMSLMMNISSKAYNCHGKLANVRDRDCANDS